MSEVKHNPLPWTAGLEEKFGHEIEIKDATGRIVAVVEYDDGYGQPDACLIVAAVNSHADLLAYAMLEAEYSRQCDRTRPDYSPAEFRDWVEKNITGNEPIGRWLGRIREAAIRKATQGT